MPIEIGRARTEKSMPCDHRSACPVHIGRAVGVCRTCLRSIKKKFRAGSAPAKSDVIPRRIADRRARDAIRAVVKISQRVIAIHVDRRVRPLSGCWPTVVENLKHGGRVPACHEFDCEISCAERKIRIPVQRKYIARPIK